MTNSVLDCARLVAVGEQHEIHLQYLHWNLAAQNLVEVVFAEVFELALLLQLAWHYWHSALVVPAAEVVARSADSYVVAVAFAFASRFVVVEAVIAEASFVAAVASELVDSS